ncbi:drug/metabolite transporter (DMT)-like permease [Natronospira proteinivora]|uniref:Drug/metabolite transporter (DMT)-like permease n=1 Tax=Natronospira proteinivora TaxID=1807133 RepID=A0ABT1GAA5_9GAMM|nr:DMT family transporter [Natronospira proteinivora]MCP1728261.1 drug/metabolite transporter (DMT)-like permease [Natronospira proteinivora]
MSRTLADKGALAAFVLLVVVWGYNWVVMKIALQYSGALDFAVLRSLGGMVCLFLITAAFRIPIMPRSMAWVLALGLLQTTGFTGLVTLALESEGAGKTAVLAFTMPFWVLGFAALALGERVRDWQWLAVTLALTGLMLLIGPWDPDLRTPGSLLAVGAGAAWGASVVVAKKIPMETRWELIPITAWQMALGVIPLILLLPFVEQPTIDWNAAYIGALLFNILPANALAWLFWLYIVSRLPAGVTGLSALVIPVIGSTAAWLQLGERPSGLEGTGMALILLALTVLSLRGYLRWKRRGEVSREGS